MTPRRVSKKDIETLIIPLVNKYPERQIIEAVKKQANGTRKPGAPKSYQGNAVAIWVVVEHRHRHSNQRKEEIFESLAADLRKYTAIVGKRKPPAKGSIGRQYYEA